MERYVRSFIRDDEQTEFLYEDPFDWDRDIGAEEQQHKIPAGETQGHGEYQAPATLQPRLFSIRGRIIASKPSELQQRIDTLMAAHPVEAAGRLRRKIVDGPTVISDRFIECQVSYRNPGVQTGLPNTRWEIGFRAAKPWYQDWDLQAPVALNAGGGTVALETGGTEYCAPRIVLDVTAPGTLLLTPGRVGSRDANFTRIVVPEAGTYVIDMDAQTVTVFLGEDVQNGIDLLAESAGGGGGFWTIPPFATTLTLGLTGGATLSGAVAQWRRRFSFS